MVFSKGLLAVLCAVVAMACSTIRQDRGPASSDFHRELSERVSSIPLDIRMAWDELTSLSADGRYFVAGCGELYPEGGFSRTACGSFGKDPVQAKAFSIGSAGATRVNLSAPLPSWKPQTSSAYAIGGQRFFFANPALPNGASYDGRFMPLRERVRNLLSRGVKASITAVDLERGEVTPFAALPAGSVCTALFATETRLICNLETLSQGRFKSSYLIYALSPGRVLGSQTPVERVEIDTTAVVSPIDDLAFGGRLKDGLILGSLGALTDGLKARRDYVFFPDTGAIHYDESKPGCRKQRVEILRKSPSSLAVATQWDCEQPKAWNATFQSFENGKKIGETTFHREGRLLGYAGSGPDLVAAMQFEGSQFGNWEEETVFALFSPSPKALELLKYSDSSMTLAPKAVLPEADQREKYGYGGAWHWKPESATLFFNLMKEPDSVDRNQAEAEAWSKGCPVRASFADSARNALRKVSPLILQNGESLCGKYLLSQDFAPLSRMLPSLVPVRRAGAASGPEQLYFDETSGTLYAFAKVDPVRPGVPGNQPTLTHFSADSQVMVYGKNEGDLRKTWLVTPR
ncbi:MAG: hypothetical protein NDJ90_14500 [Oligoflexia bacterium]|nr:hypothetical protein [Oligoflexia bacterium]